MASDWIPIRVDLLDDPAVIAIAGELGLDEFAIAGRLLKLWAWCNKQLSNGDAAGVTELWIDRYVNATGFAAAMIRAGWLEKQPSGIEFPKFDRWNSKGAKRRVLTARRMRSHRVPGDANRDANRDAPSVTDASTREEKRREEKRNTEEREPANAPAANATPPAKSTAIATAPNATEFPGSLAGNPEFAAAWAEWVADRKARRNALTAQAVKLQLGKLEPLGPIQAAECIRQSIEKGWTGLFPERFRGRGGGGGGFKTRAEAESEYAANILINAIGGPRDGIEF